MTAMTPAEALRASESKATPDPAIADALERDRKVAEEITGWWAGTDADQLARWRRIAALYPETRK